MATLGENDKENKNSDPPAKVPGNAPEQLELFDPIREMLAIERERIDSMNRRTEIAREAIHLSDVADKRQFDYRMEDLRTRDEAIKGGMPWRLGSCGAAESSARLCCLVF